MTTIQIALNSELETLNARYELALRHAADMLHQARGNKSSTHLGHNLGNRAVEIAEIASKIESVQSVLNFLATEGN